MDVLADILTSTRVDGVVLARSRNLAPWGIGLDAELGAGFHLVTEGACWLRFEDRPPLQLLQGDLVLISSGAPHGLSDALDTPLVPLVPLAKIRRPARRAEPRSGRATELICGAYRSNVDGPHPLLSLLPEVLHVSGSRVQANEALRSTVRLLVAELEQPGPGGNALVERLVDALLVYVVRDWLATQPEGTAGWLGALRDPQVGKALGLLHDRPSKDWSVETIGKAVGLSRAALARRFTALVGQPPLLYLARLRMDLATRLLRETTLPLAQVAARVGYESEFAFSRAYKRHRGVSPGAARRGAGSAEHEPRLHLPQPQQR